MIYIRTDANSIIASGHVMRCLTIAEELIRHSEKVCFVVSDEESAQLIYNCKIPISVIIMNDNWNMVDIDYEYQFFANIVDKDVLLVDSYYISSLYLSEMKKLFLVVTFDDLFSEVKEADVIINYNLFYDIFDYKKRYNDKNCKLLLGGKYVPLRQEFELVKAQESVRKFEQPSILVVCGGGDAKNMILCSLQTLRERDRLLFESISWKVVIGKYYPYRKQLEEFVKDNNNIELYININYMAQVMSECDLCITAASTVLYECCSMLLPALFFVTAEDQKYDKEVFNKIGMIYCGDFIKEAKSALHKLGDVLFDVAFDKEKQQSMKNLMKGKIDGLGAKRIANTIIKIKRDRKW